jgi:hypothetical protein
MAPRLLQKHKRHEEEKIQTKTDQQDVAASSYNEH